MGKDETMKPDETDLCNEGYSATYCPEDNKIRLYTDRVERSTFLWLRAIGYKATPKQSCSFVATWSPRAEDAAFMMIADGDDIGDEDETPEDRAADRAERFAMYREKRRAEAHGFADTYEASPDAYGHQNAAKAERAAARRDRIGGKACSQWAKAEYWQYRTAGVISHALHKSDARTRRLRILRLEADQRRWGKHSPRWDAHFNLRLEYERAMLANEGGSAGDVEMKPGGKLGSHLITKVNKSNATGAVVSVNVHAPKQEGEGWDYRRRGNTLLINVQRFGESVYTPPTPESLAELAEITKASKAKTKARNAKSPKLINPTDEDAERIQAAWNTKPSWMSQDKPGEVFRMTQAQYSALSKGTYSPAKPVYIDETGKPTHRKYCGNTPDGAACKVRRIYHNDCYRVIVITDKPQKPLPAASPAEQAEAVKV